MQYNASSLPVLSYVGQLRPPPVFVPKWELRTLSKLLRLPGNTLPVNAFSTLSTLGYYDISSAWATLLAASDRVASCAVSCWPFWIDQVSKHALDHLPLARVLGGCVALAFWDNRACALYLFRAIKTFSNFSSSPLSFPNLLLDLPLSFYPCAVSQRAAYNKRMQARCICINIHIYRYMHIYTCFSIYVYMYIYIYTYKTNLKKKAVGWLLNYH